MCYVKCATVNHKQCEKANFVYATCFRLLNYQWTVEKTKQNGFILFTNNFSRYGHY